MTISADTETARAERLRATLRAAAQDRPLTPHGPGRAPGQAGSAPRGAARIAPWQDDGDDDLFENVPI